MTVAQVLFIILVFITFYNNGVQFYIHQEAYPLLRKVGKADFAAYIKEYEDRLKLPLLYPYGLTVLSNISLLTVGSPKIPAILLIIALILNVGVAAVTMLIATPVYKKVKAAKQASGEDMEQLMKINLLRLVLTTFSSVVMIYLLFVVTTTL